MTDMAMEHVQAAIRHRNLSLRAFAAMLCAVAALTTGLAVVRASIAGAAAADEPLLAGLWPDFATLVLGHFALAFLIAVVLHGVLELTVLRHLRAIARQVRGGGWLAREQPVRLNRPGLGVADDIDRIVAALNEARGHRAGSLSALVRQIGERRAAEERLCHAVSRLEAENEALRRVAGGQAPSPHAQDVGSCAEAGGRRSASAALPGAAERDRVGRATVLGDDSGGPSVTGGVSRGPVALEELVSGAVSDIGGEIAAVGAAVEMTPLPVVIGDAGKLARLFRGLVSAAIRLHSPCGPPSVRIMAGQCGANRRVCIFVRSTGIRIGLAARDPLVPFTSGPREMDPADEQADLALCRRIAAEHGSAIALRPAPGGGTVFEVSLEAF